MTKFRNLEDQRLFTDFQGKQQYDTRPDECRHKHEIDSQYVVEISFHVKHNMNIISNVGNNESGMKFQLGRG